MYYQRLSDEEILRGFRKGNEAIIREYFYGYCRVGYQLFDKRYQLSGKGINYYETELFKMV